MIEFFRIQNFICFEDLKLEGLSKINLFVGKANTGKTALLFAFSLYFNVPILSRYMLIPSDVLFHNFDISKNIYLAGGRQNKIEKEVIISKKGADTLILTNENGYKKLANLFLKPSFPYLTDKFVEENKEILLKLLQILDPEISALVKKSSIYHVEFNNRISVPLVLCGESLTKAIEIVFQLKTYKVALIDNVEAYFHHSVFSELWKIIDEISQDCQVFATTYNYECIRSAPHHTVLYRLEKQSQVIQAIYYPSEALQATLDIGVELR